MSSHLDRPGGVPRVVTLVPKEASITTIDERGQAVAHFSSEEVRPECWRRIRRQLFEMERHEGVAHD